MRQEWLYKIEGFLKTAKICGFLLVLAAGIVTCAAQGSALAATSRFIWSNPSTGFAIGGFDPLSYFTTRRPRKGVKEFEYEWRGVTFRFANEGNMAAFRQHPEIYTPQFGGYDAYAMADGTLVESNPLIWMKRKNRVYLFTSRKNRALWLIRRDDKVAEAARYWKEISKDLVE